MLNLGLVLIPCKGSWNLGITTKANKNKTWHLLNLLCFATAHPHCSLYRGNGTHEFKWLGSQPFLIPSYCDYLLQYSPKIISDYMYHLMNSNSREVLGPSNPIKKPLSAWNIWSTLAKHHIISSHRSCQVAPRIEGKRARHEMPSPCLAMSTVDHGHGLMECILQMNMQDMM